MRHTMLVRDTAPNAVLESIFERHEVLDAQDRPLPLRSNVTLQHAAALFRTIVRERPRRVLEIGMAYGVTSLAIAAALEEVGEDGTLITIDPYQSTRWGGIGFLNLRRAGLDERVKLLEAFDYVALPRLLAAGQEFDFAYIDGSHNFEYVFLDFFYLDKMLAPGGVVGFNDCDWLPVRAVLRFVRRHRDYERIDVGLPPAYGNRIGWTRTLRQLDRRATGGRATESRVIGALLGRRREDQYYRKLSARDTPEGFWTRF